MARPPRIVRRLAVAVCVVSPLIGSSGDEPAGSPRAAPRGEVRTQVVIYVAGVKELRLDPGEQPALRALARRGVSFPDLAALRRDELLGALREVGGGMGDAYRELPVGGAAVRRVGGALSDLVSELGEPPPVSKKEKEALRRLGEGGSLDGVTGGAARLPPPGDEASAPGLAAALRGGARLVLLLAGEGSIEGDEQLRDASSFVLERGDDGKDGAADDGASTSPRDRLLLVVLFAEGGDAAIIVSGRSFRKGRVHRESLDARDVAAGVRAFLGLSAREDGGSAAWLSAGRVGSGEEARRDGR